MSTRAEAFADEFRTYVKRVREFQDDAIGQRFQKLILVAVLDALARSVYPNDGNRDRFTAFIRHYAQWHCSDLVSLPHLRRLLQRIPPQPEFNAAREFAAVELAKWPAHGNLIPAGVDPSIADVLQRWPVALAKRIFTDLSLESLTHIRLFYAYRNALVHEFRTPSEPPEFLDEVDAYYIDWTHGDGAVDWRLTYPLAFFYKLAATCLDNLEAYFSRSSIDPYRHYPSGDFFLPQLETTDGIPPPTVSSL